jgi:cellulose synthase (UDP-forming)
MAARLLAGAVRAFLPLRTRRRRAPRRLALLPLALVAGDRRRLALRLDVSAGGEGVLVLGRARPPDGPLPLLGQGGIRWARVAYRRRVLPGVWRLGLAHLPVPLAGASAEVYLAA